MLRGISGHAGLFATANDLLQLMELYRRNGGIWRRTDYGKDVMKEYTGFSFLITTIEEAGIRQTAAEQPET
jgi:CubicO group peptidase (beta-lactamase class C family)